jgi:coenzyme PQQ precursor peptide PqqA
MDQLASRGLGELLHGARRPFSSRTAVIDLSWRLKMKWNSPKIVEVLVGMEINMYACASRNSG